VKSRLLVTIVLAVVVVPLLVAGLGYYYLFATLAGTFSVPALYSARLTAPDGGRILVEGVGVTGWRARGSRWRARYAPPGSERSEDVGSWIGGHDEFAIVSAAGHLVLIAGPDQVFVRTEKGPWKSFPVPFVDEWERLGLRAGGPDRLRAELGWARDAPLPRAAVSYYSAPREELVVNLTRFGAVAGRLSFQLSPDGEGFDLIRVQKPSTARPATSAG
jgi:hypothetical protein